VAVWSCLSIDVELWLWRPSRHLDLGTDIDMRLWFSRFTWHAK
jgi:hypothetical protein